MHANFFTNYVSILINDQPISQEFHLMKLAMKNAVRQNQLSLPLLIIGFCIIVAMVKVIFQHPLWKNNTLPLAIRL